jgi:hypothetical protein
MMSFHSHEQVHGEAGLHEHCQTRALESFFLLILLQLLLHLYGVLLLSSSLEHGPVLQTMLLTCQLIHAVLLCWHLLISIPTLQLLQLHLLHLLQCVYTNYYYNQYVTQYLSPVLQTMLQTCQLILVVYYCWHLLFIPNKKFDTILSLSFKRGIDRAKLLVDNNANVKAEDQVNLRVLPLTHTSSIFS